MNYAQLKGERITRCDATWLPLAVPLQDMAGEIMDAVDGTPRFPCGHAMTPDNTQRFKNVDGVRTPIDPLCKRCRFEETIRQRTAKAIANGAIMGHELFRLAGIVGMAMAPCTAAAVGRRVACGTETARLALVILVDRGLMECSRRGNTKAMNNSFLYSRVDGLAPPDPATVDDAERRLLNRTRAKRGRVTA